MATDLTQSDSTDAISAAYSPELFERLADVWKNRLTSHLSRLSSKEGKVLNWSDPAALVAAAESFLQTENTITVGEPDEQFSHMLDTMLASGQNLHHPRYIGHQVPASLPPAALLDAVGSVTNQPMAIYEMGPWATAVEHAIVRALQRKVGWIPDDCAGRLTSGGSLANLTALLTARNVVFPNCWEQGCPDNAVVIAHHDSHYCVARAVGMLGMGTRQLRKAALDKRRRIDPQKLDDLIRQEKAAGHRVMAVSAAACATPIGAFDPLNDVADVCRKNDVWMHVDAAHGGGALMSRRHRSLLDGVEQADSLVWDAHKMMFVPALCAAVLYRDREHRFAAFQQDAPYLFDPSDPGAADFDSGMGTIECTKRALGFGLWGVWSMFGDQIFEQMVDHTFAMSFRLFEMLQNASDFEPLHEPQCNILVFRHLPEAVRSADPELQDRFQHLVRTSLIRSGRFYIVQTRLDGRVALRITVMNPQTTTAEIDELVVAIRETGQQVLKELL